MVAVAHVNQPNGLVRVVGTVLMPASQIHVAAGVPLLYSAPTGIAEPQRRPTIATRARAMLRWAVAAFYGVAGIAHFWATDRFLLIVPAWVPEPRLVVQITGACEVVGALALLVPRLQRAAALMLALYALCVFPANIKHALEGINVPGLPDTWWYHGPRLVLQPVIIWLTLYAGQIVNGPFYGFARTKERRPPEPR